MSARTGPVVIPLAGGPIEPKMRYVMARRIEGLEDEMDLALAEGQYERVVQLAEETEQLLEAMMT